MTTRTLPTYFMSHGGGPWPWMKDQMRGAYDRLEASLAVIYPNADVPVLQLSLKRGYDPSDHIAVGRALAPRRPWTVLSSDLQRARETARALASEVGLEVRTDARLRETDLGTWQGMSHSEVDELWPEARMRWRSTPPVSYTHLTLPTSDLV